MTAGRGAGRVGGERAQHVEAGHPRHVDVHQHQLGRELADRLQRARAVAAAADELELRHLAHPGGERVARERFVFGDQGRVAHRFGRFHPAERNQDLDLEAGARRRAHLELRRAVEVELEAAPQRAQADTAGAAGEPAASGSRRRRRARVRASASGSSVAARLDPHRAAGDLRRDAVDDAVLDQRLQRQRRDRVAERGRIDLPVDLQARAETQRLEREVVAHERELVLEGDAVGRSARRVEHVAHHPREAQQRFLGGGRVLARQDQQRVERVEEEVRIELAADVGELGAHQRRFGTRGGDGDAMRAPRMQRAGEAENQREVGEHAPHRAPEDALLEGRRRVVGAEQAPGDEVIDQLPGDDEGERADDVPARPPRPTRPSGAAASAPTAGPARRGRSAGRG